MNVEWIGVNGHPNYEINNYGDIRDIRTGKIIRQYPSKTRGYLRVRIDGKLYDVHKLMMMSFYPDVDPGHYVRHIDRDRTNNYLDNLEYINADYR